MPLDTSMVSERIAPSTINPELCVIVSGHKVRMVMFIRPAIWLISYCAFSEGGNIMTSFDQFIDAVKQQMQPAGRAQHLVGILQQLFAFNPEGATLADMVAGWHVLARPQSQNEEASVAHRRQICAALSAIAAQFISEPGNLAGAVKTWQAWQDAFQRSTDSRQATMAKTLARELVELQSAPENSTFARP